MLRWQEGSDIYQLIEGTGIYTRVGRLGLTEGLEDWRG